MHLFQTSSLHSGIDATSIVDATGGNWRSAYLGVSGEYLAKAWVKIKEKHSFDAATHVQVLYADACGLLLREISSDERYRRSHVFRQL